MRSGKDEQNQMSPLFPRMCISKGRRGAPRAPPRNKMAVSEHRNVPAESVSHGSNLVPSTSHNQGSHYKGAFSAFKTRGTTSSSHFYSGLNSDKKLSDVIQPIQSKYCNGSSGNGNDCLFRKIKNLTTYSGNEVSVEDNFVVPSLPRLRKYADGGNSRDTTSRKLASSSTDSSRKLSLTFINKVDETGAGDLGPRQHLTSRNEEDRELGDTSMEFSENSRVSEADNVELHTLCPKEGNTLHDPQVRSAQESRSSDEQRSHRDGCKDEAFAMRKRSASELEDKSGSSPLRSRKRLTISSDCNEELDSEPQQEDIGKNAEISEASLVDSTSALDLSPDLLVELIGQKQFWEARRLIIRQQRIFTSQVFELHRLIAVQRLIARSPEPILEDSFYLEKALREESRAEKLPSDSNVLDLPPLVARPKVDSQKPKGSTHQSTCKPKMASSPPLANDAKKAPQGFPRPDNRWLFPVSSPSEGLVYKPCSSPCVPTAALLAPMYSSCAATGISSASYQRGMGIYSGTSIGQPYLPPYGMPIIKPSLLDISNASTANFTLPYRTMFNASNQHKRVISAGSQNLLECELKISNASDPSDKKRGDELPLFPTVPTVELNPPVQDKNSNEGIKVIKVVPHNPKLASESAARIFQTIQEERKQYA